MPGAARSADLSRSTLAELGGDPMPGREALGLPPARYSYELEAAGVEDCVISREQ
jgi:hypothetical protein